MANAWQVSGRIVCDTNGNGVIDENDVFVAGPGLRVESTLGAGVFAGAPQIQPDGTFTLALLDQPHSYLISIQTNPGSFPILIPGSGSYSFALTNESQSFGGAYFLLNCSGDVPPIPGDECGVRTPGYWKNHPEAWPAETVTIGGVIYAKAEAIEMMEGGADRSTTLFTHLVATTLNMLCGAESSCITATVAAANAWLAENPPGSGVRANSNEWKTAEPLKDMLDAYNNGLLCAESGG